MKRYKNSVYQIGYRPTDTIYISEELGSVAGRRRFVLKCDICEKEKKVWLTQISSGTWNVCEHDVL